LVSADLLSLAGPFELEPRRGDQLGHGGLAAGWALADGCITELLEEFLLEPAGLAAILVDGHRNLSNTLKKNKIIQKAVAALG
jgi:hypothetical protein